LDFYSRNVLKKGIIFYFYYHRDGKKENLTFADVFKLSTGVFFLCKPRMIERINSEIEIIWIFISEMF